MDFAKFKRKYLKSTEEVVSMFLGLVIVLVVVGLVINYFHKSKGLVTVPGTSDDVSLSQESGLLKNNEYEVAKGDSLWKIAVEKYGNGYAWTEIVKVNSLKNPSVLEVGQKIIIPEKVIVSGEEIKVGSVVAAELNSIKPGEYEVAKGDSLWKIAVRAYGDGYQWTKIWQENRPKLPQANGLEIGMILIIPELD